MNPSLLAELRIPHVNRDFHSFLKSRFTRACFAVYFLALLAVGEGAHVILPGMAHWLEEANGRLVGIGTPIHTGRADEGVAWNIQSSSKFRVLSEAECPLCQFVGLAKAFVAPAVVRTGAEKTARVAVDVSRRHGRYQVVRLLARGPPSWA